jgi:hypothetical protein
MSGQDPSKSFPRDLLERILVNNGFEEEDIEKLCMLEESTWHDFKSAQGLGLDGKTARKKAAQDLRQDVTAFANSDGGLLVFGVDDKDRQTRIPVPTEAEKWATDVIRPLVEAGMPMPRVAFKDKLMVIAVPRSPQLLPVVCDGSVTYFMRLNDTTARVPEFLLTDLFHGRRAHAEFAITRSEAHWVADSMIKTPSFGLELIVTNESPQWVDDCRFYLIGISTDFPAPAPTFATTNVVSDSPSRILCKQITVQKVGDRPPTSGTPVSMPPFTSARLSILVRPPDTDGAKQGRWRGGLVVAPKGSRMQWFQVDVAMDIASAYDAGMYRPDQSRRWPVPVEPMLSERPIVSWSVVE